MKYKAIIFILLAIFVSQSQVSCKKDFLETPPKTQLVREQYVNNLQTCAEFLNGTYVDLTANFCYRYALVYSDLIADNIKPVTGSSNYLMQYSWSQLANEATVSLPNGFDMNMNSIWTYGYRVIRDCNFILENIEKFRSENTVIANNIKGQAFALRALVHHQLVNIFGQPYLYSANAAHQGIPYITTSDFTNNDVIRLTVAEVYESIISDLTQAISLLPPSQSSTLYISGTAAKALLSRVFLFKGNFEEAKIFSSQVAKSVPLMAGTDYPSKLFSPQESEALFQLAPGNGPSGNGYFTSFASYLYRRKIQFNATTDIANILQERPNDKRKVWVTLSSGKWNVTKFPVGVVPNIPEPAEAYYHTLIRSSEMFLTAAEAYARTNREDSARIFLDAIRKRADSGVESISAVGSALLDSIYKERRKELCFENFRFFDLLRNGQSINRSDALPSVSKNLPFPNSKAVAPIPAFDVRYYGIQQNPDY